MPVLNKKIASTTRSTTTPRVINLPLLRLNLFAISSQVRTACVSGRQSTGHPLTQVVLTTYFFFTAFISDSSITGAGPEMPPSLRMRQKCTAIKIEATSGMPMQCQM